MKKKKYKKVKIQILMWYVGVHNNNVPALSKIKAKSAHFHVPKNGTSEAEPKKRRPIFVANYPPKWCTARSFYAFSTFGWVLSQFWKIVFQEPFRSRFYFYMGEKPKVPNDNQRSAQIKKLKKTN